MLRTNDSRLEARMTQIETMTIERTTTLAHSPDSNFIGRIVRTEMQNILHGLSEDLDDKSTWRAHKFRELTNPLAKHVAQEIDQSIYTGANTQKHVIGEDNAALIGKYKISGISDPIHEAHEKITNLSAECVDQSFVATQVCRVNKDFWIYKWTFGTLMIEVASVRYSRRYPTYEKKVLRVIFIPAPRLLTVGFSGCLMLNSNHAGYRKISPMFRSFPVVPSDAPIIQAICDADIGEVRRLFTAGLASPFDTTDYGCSLLYVSNQVKVLFHANISSVRCSIRSI